MMAETALIGLRGHLIIGIDKEELDFFNLSPEDFFSDCEVAIECPIKMLVSLNDRTMREALQRKKGGPDDLLNLRKKKSGH